MRHLIISLALSFCIIFPAFSAAIKLKEQAPERYTIQPNDTLLSISERYLEYPWEWPTLWKMSAEDIKNPHWLYPGDTLLLRLENGQPRLSLSPQSREIKLSPQARMEALDKAIPSIPAVLIDPFLKRPLLVNPDEFKQAPTLVAGTENHLAVQPGDKVYAAGVRSRGTWQAYRLGKELINPNTKKSLGYEAIYTGDLLTEKLGEDIQTLIVTSVEQELLIGDHLMQAPKATFINYAPHIPDHPIKANIISIYGNAVEAAAQHSSVTLNIGKNDGVEIGHILNVIKKGEMVTIRDSQHQSKKVQLPTENIGELFVYRVFDNVSYALILKNTLPIYVGDEVNSPEIDRD